MSFIGLVFPREYATAIRKIRAIGRHCIELRLKALDNKEELPFDIMSQILSIVREFHCIEMACFQLFFIYSDIEKNFDIEDLVDEFFVFYLAGLCIYCVFFIHPTY